jgi:KTSC domain
LLHCYIELRSENAKADDTGTRFAEFVAMICATSGLCAERTDRPKHAVSHISRQSAQSSAIAKIGYTKRRHILEIEFINGGLYRYSDVPVTIYHDLMTAESKARFYDANVRKHYRSVLVRQRQKQESNQPAQSKATSCQHMIRRESLRKNIRG